MKKWLSWLLTGALLLGILILGACSGGGGGGGSEESAAPEEQQETETNEEEVASDGIQERTIKVGNGHNESNPQSQGMIKFKELVEERSGGKITVNLYFDATLGDDLQMTEALQAGTQEMTIPSTSPLTGIVPEFGIFDFPFIINNEEEADALLDGPIGQKVMDLLDEHGLVGLGYWENGFRQMTNSKVPIEKAEDFQGLKIRTMQNEIHLEAFKRFGANPTPMAFSEVFTALENKTIDGQENPLPTIRSSKFYEVQPYLTISNHVYTPYIVLFSKKIWDEMSEEEQTLIREAAIEAGQYQRQLNREENLASLEYLKEQGMTVTELSDEERAKLQELVRPVIDEFAQKINPELVEEMFQELEKIRN